MPYSSTSLFAFNNNRNSRLDAVSAESNTIIKPTTSTAASPLFLSSSSATQSIKNLKKLPSNLPDDTFINQWKELQGLSEKELLTLASSLTASQSGTITVTTNKQLMPLSKILVEENSDRYNKALGLAYRRCEYLTQLFSKTFYMGTSVMPTQARKHVWAIYAWCRRTDDLVDSPRACLLNRDTLSDDLVLWNQRLESIFNNEPYDLFDFAMVDTVKKYPDLSIEPFKDMIKGMVMDVPGLGQERYQNFDELYLYCYRVAGTVGLMTLPMLGTGKYCLIALLLLLL